jgi:hypothetical protein
MRRTTVLALLLVVAGGLAIQADTVKLKNGRVVKGRVVQFRNGEFTVEVSPGERVLLLQESVESIEFEGGTTPAPSGGSAAGGMAAEKTVVLDSSQEVVATGIQLRKGDKVVIRASGEMTWSDGRKTSPAGTASRDSFLPFPGEPLGALMAMVGSAMSPTYHVIGENAEFTPGTDGELYLQINARSLEGARGSYTARVQTPMGATASAGTPASGTGTTTTTTTERSLRKDLEVPANQEWVDTGIDLREGDVLRIVAEGTINYTTSKTCGPNGGERDWQDLLRRLPVNDQGRGALIGKMGEGGAVLAFFVGEHAQFTVERKGRLFLGINDDDYRNNSGSFHVRIRLNPPR